MTLRCPACAREVESTRRPPHVPCVVCALAGRVVAMVDASPVPPPPPETKLRILGSGGATDMTNWRWDCAKNGCVFVGTDPCAHCGAPFPEIIGVKRKAVAP